MNTCGKNQTVCTGNKKFPCDRPVFIDNSGAKVHLRQSFQNNLSNQSILRSQASNPKLDAKVDKRLKYWHESRARVSDSRKGGWSKAPGSERKVRGN